MSLNSAKAALSVAAGKKRGSTMAYCKKCGAYIPIDETACPACGYDPEEEARQAEAAKRAEEEAARRAEEQRRRKQEADNWAARERAREEERRRAAQQNARTGSYGAAQSQYTSQRTGASGASQTQYTSQRTENTWVPPWSQSENQSNQSSYARPNDYSEMQRQARESVENQKLSVLSYIWPLALIPLILRGKDDFARYHANQGLVLLIAEGIGSAALSMLGLESLGFLVGLAGLAGTIKGISNVLRGKKEPLPFIGGINLLK